MDKEARNTVHELVTKFKVKSQSTGSGDQRRPILYRTKSTFRYAQGHEEEVMSHINSACARIRRKYFQRVDKKGGGRGTGYNNGRVSQGALSYREGEVVGASAPQIGQGNKGHAMLEKMGWTSGMGLGSAENKGILEPVSQVVKRSKAGLG
jgi:hypothetical protein